MKTAPPMNFPLLNNLTNLLNQIRADFFIVGLALAGVMGVIAICQILINQHSRSGGVRQERWEGLTLVFVCVGLLAGLMSILAFAQSFGTGLGATS